MIVSRRTALKQVLLVSAGLALLPSCIHHSAPATVKVKNLPLNGDDEAVLAALSDALIPGAQDVASHKFAINIVDDCFPKDKQQQWVDGLKAFHKDCKKEYSKTFDKFSPEEKKTFLTKQESNKENDFYNTTKGLIIQGYTSSAYYLTKVQVYELVPGRFHGGVPVKNI